MEDHELHKKLHDLPKQINDAGREWASKKETSDMFESTTKSLLSAIMCEKEGSESARQRQAYADERYKTHIRALVESSKETLIAKVRYESLIRLHESVRTQISLEKAKANIR